VSGLILISPPNPLRPIPDRDGLPLGLCMIGSMVRDRIEVHIIDAYSPALSVDETVRASLEKNPDLIGVGIPFFVCKKSALEIAAKLKSERKDIPIITGGSAATIRADYLLETGLFDLVALGEAEMTISEIIDRYLKNGFYGITNDPPKGTGVKGKASIDRPLIENLDELPYPSYDLLSGFPSEYSARILTSRGCAFRCPYCQSTRFWGNVYRTHSPERVVEEIHRLRDSWDVHRVSFADDAFNLDRNRARRIAEKLIEADLGVEWGASSRAECLSEDDLTLFAKAGMTGLFIGLESGSANILKSINRNHDPETARRMIEYAENLGIATHVSFMIGLPDETADDVETTLEYARSLRSSSLGFHIFHPLPGSEYGENLEKYGLVSGSGEETGELIGAIDTYSIYRTRHLTTMQIIEYFDRARAIQR
jgi:anaerobic magnesium-protoporphyrin IX monomethyl ester cyclase